MIVIVAILVEIVAAVTAVIARAENITLLVTERKALPRRRCPLCQILKRHTQV